MRGSRDGLFTPPPGSLSRLAIAGLIHHQYVVGSYLIAQPAPPAPPSLHNRLAETRETFRLAGVAKHGGRGRITPAGQAGIRRIKSPSKPSVKQNTMLGEQTNRPEV